MHLWGSESHAVYSIRLCFISDGALIWGRCQKVVSGLIIMGIYDRWGGFLVGAWEWFQGAYIIVTPCLCTMYKLNLVTRTSRNSSVGRALGLWVIVVSCTVPLCVPNFLPSLFVCLYKYFQLETHVQNDWSVNNQIHEKYSALDKGYIFRFFLSCSNRPGLDLNANIITSTLQTSFDFFDFWK